MMADKNSLLSNLPEDLYRCGEDVGERHAVDWTAENSHLPEVVLLPRNTEDVSVILKACHAGD